MKYPKTTVASDLNQVEKIVSYDVKGKNIFAQTGHQRKSSNGGITINATDMLNIFRSRIPTSYANVLWAHHTFITNDNYLTTLKAQIQIFSM